MDEAVTRKNASQAPDHFYGRVLKPGEMLEHARYSSVRVVAERLRPFVKRYWAVDWDLPAGESYLSSTVSEPTIHLTFEYGTSRRSGIDGPGVWVTGPVTQRHFDVGIFGRGGVFGVNFHLGATLAFSDQEPAGIADATVPAAQWFPRLASDLGLVGSRGELPSEVPDVGALAESVESWLLSRRPQMTQGYARLRRTLAVLDDPEVITQTILAERIGVSERTLQRMFRSYCGVGVKTILIRARVRDAVAAIDRGWERSFAELAASLGWFDQSHFTADFRRSTGYTPSEYLAAREEQSTSVLNGR